MSLKTQIINDGAAGYWKFDEKTGTVAADASGNGHSGTYTGGITLGSAALTSEPGYSATFDGSTGYVTVPNAAWLNSTTQTIFARIKPTAETFNPSDVTVIAGRWAGGGSQPLFMWINSAGKLGASANANQAKVTGSTTLVAGQTYSVHARVNGTTLDVFVNGVLDGSAPLAATLQTGGNANFIIGQVDIALGVASYNYAGVIDEVALFPSGLTDNQIGTEHDAAVANTLYKQIMSSGPTGFWLANEASGTTVTDYAPAPLGDWTLYGGYTRNQPTMISDGSGDTSTSTDGSTGYGLISTSALGSVTTWSWEAVISPTEDWSGITGGPFFGHTHNNTGLPIEVGISVDGATNGRFSAGFYAVSGGWRVVNAPAQTFAQGASHHFGATYDGTNVTLYIDGTQVAQAAVAAGIQANTANQLRLATRWDASGTNEHIGIQFQYMAVYANKVLTATDFANHANAAFYIASPPTAPTVVLNAVFDGGGKFTWNQTGRGDTQWDWSVDGGATYTSVSSTKTVVTGLTNGQQYNFIVREVNSVGPGAWSGPVPFTPTATYLYDDFNRLDSTTSPGSPVQGAAYTVLSGGVWGIFTNRLYAPTTSDLGFLLGGTDAVNVDMRMTIARPSSNNHDFGFVFRYQDTNNVWLVTFNNGATQCYRRINAASWIELSRSESAAYALGDVARVVAYQRRVYVFKNGVLVHDFNDPFYNPSAAANKFGLRMGSQGGTTGNMADDFTVSPPDMTVFDTNGGLKDDRIAAVMGDAFLYKGRDMKSYDAGSVA